MTGTIPATFLQQMQQMKRRITLLERRGGGRGRASQEPIAVRSGYRTGSVSVPPGLTKGYNPGWVENYNYGFVHGGSAGGWTLPESGVYAVSAGIRLSGQATSEVQLRITIASREVVISSGRFYISAAAEAWGDEGEVVELDIFNNNSSDVVVEPFTGFELPFLAISLRRKA